MKKRMYTNPKTDILSIQGEQAVLILPSPGAPEPATGAAPAMRNNAPLKF